MAAAATLLLAGCGGTKFSSVTAVPADKALVYVYRNAALGGILGNHVIFANGQPITSLYSGSYFPYSAEPGTNYFSSQAFSPSAILDMSMNAQFKNRVCQINAEAGKTYYVQFQIATTWGPKMTQVDPAKGAKEIPSCKLAKALNKTSGSANTNQVN